MWLERKATGEPLFSVCVPQYNRTSFLRLLLDSIRAQTFRDFEICISDGGSNDGRHTEIIEWLNFSGMPFRFARTELNLQYDANLRASLTLARGRYCVLFGNDDVLAGEDSLADLADAIRQSGFPQVVLTNYLEMASGTVRRRVRAPGLLGAGPAAALRNFRNFSFVSGIVLERESAQRFATAKWDGSEMYQTYVACRMIAAGGMLLGLERVIVHKDVQVAGETADSYAQRPRVQVSGIRAICLPLCRYGQVAFDAIAPYLERPHRGLYAASIMAQLVVFTYPPWLVEYRRVQSWRFAACFALGMRPGNLLGRIELRWWSRSCLWVLYSASTLAGLLVPPWLFGVLRPALYALAKMGNHRRVMARGSSTSHGPVLSCTR